MDFELWRKTNRRRYDLAKLGTRIGAQAQSARSERTHPAVRVTGSRAGSLDNAGRMSATRRQGCRRSAKMKETYMTELERILDQLKRAYEGDAWHGPSVKEVLNGVTAAQAHARPLQNAHTIYELARHIAVWEDVGRRRLQGDPANIPISSREDWPPADDTSEVGWEQAKAALDRGHQALVEAIKAVPESRLDEPILEGKSSVYVTLHGVIQHDLYHAGQIAILKRAMK
jgi:uncharacterized damage-inducible protein DinB